MDITWWRTFRTDNSSAASTARAGSAGAARACASAASMTGAFPLRSISSPARHGLLAGGAARLGDLQPAVHAHPCRCLSQARSAALAGAPST